MTPQHPRRAVYTALIGGYETLQEQPVAVDSDVTFICFTDDESLTSTTWDVRRVRPLLPADPVRSARTLKVWGHPDLDDFDETLWIDNTVQLRADPAVLLDDWLVDSDFAVPWHDFRGTLASEFAAVIDAAKDEPARVREQFEHYQRHRPESLTAEVLWTALMARRGDRVEATMGVWLSQVLRYSRRDQLSLPYALYETGQRVRVVEIDSALSAYHRWPVVLDRKTRVVDTTDRATPMLAQYAAEVDELTRSMLDAVESRERIIQSLEQSRALRYARRLRAFYNRARHPFRTARVTRRH